MKQPTRDEKAFEQLRQLPTELSRDQVQSIITLLPNLPPPSGGWFSSFSLNSILMSTIIVSTLAVLGFFFTSSENTTPLVENGDDRIENSFFDKAVTSLVGSDIFMVENNLKGNLNPEKYSESSTINTTKYTDNQLIVEKDTVKPLSTKTLFEPDNTLPSLAKLAPIKELEALENPFGNDLALTQNNDLNFTSSLGSDRDLFVDNNTTLFPPDQPQKVQSDWGESMCSVEFKFDQKLNVFKNRLLRHLERDGLINSTKKQMCCYYTAEQIIINDQQISADLEQKYRDFFADYELEPCDQRIIQTTSDYIAIGYMSSEGFKGSIYGKTDLGTLNLIPRSPLLKTVKGIGMQKETRPIKAFHTLKTDGLAVVYLTDTRQNEAQLEVTGMPISDVITREENGVLTITTRGEHQGESIKVCVSSDQLKSIEVAGSSQLLPETIIEANQLAIKVLDTGSAWVKVAVNELEITMQGGDLNIDGAANTRRLIDLDTENRGTLLEADLKISNRINDAETMTSCFEYLKVSEYDLGRLEEELRDLIIQQKSITNLNFPVHITMQKQQIQLNNQELSIEQSEDFFDLIRQYDIRICKDRLIAVGKRFIVIGDVQEAGFRGTALGKKIEFESRYGKITMHTNNNYHTLNTISWGTQMRIND